MSPLKRAFVQSVSKGIRLSREVDRNIDIRLKRLQLMI